MMRERTFLSLILVFENTDLAVLSPNDIAFLEVRGVKEKITYSSFEEEVEHAKEAEQVYLRLSGEAKRHLLKVSLVPLGDWLTHFHDITELEFQYDDGTLEEVALPWKEEDGDKENPRQRNLFGQDEQITILIDSEAYPFQSLGKKQ